MEACAAAGGVGVAWLPVLLQNSEIIIIFVLYQYNLRIYKTLITHECNLYPIIL